MKDILEITLIMLVMSLMLITGLLTQGQFWPSIEAPLLEADTRPALLIEPLHRDELGDPPRDLKWSTCRGCGKPLYACGCSFAGDRSAGSR